MDKEGHSFTWKIENFLWNACTVGEYIESPKFKTEMCGLFTKWRLRIYPSKKSDTIGCYLQRVDVKGPEEVAIGFTISCITADGEVHPTNGTYNFNFSKQNLLLRGCNDYWIWKYMLEKRSLYFPGDSFTVRLILWPCFLDESSLFKYFAVTNIEISKLSYSKIIPNRRLISLSLGRKVRFSPTQYPGLKIRLHLKEKSDNVSVEIRHDKTEVKRVRLNCVLSVLNLYGIPVLSEEEDYLFPLIRKAKLSFQDFISMTELSSFGVINLHFKFIVNTGKVRSRICDTECLPSRVAIASDDEVISAEQPELESIIRDSRGLKKGKLGDVKLESENETILAHKIILRTRSPVFATMFGDKNYEQENSSILIEDIDPETLKIMLQFMYTGMVKSPNVDIAIKLLSAATTYQVFSLKQKCALYLERHISVQNACLLLQLADSHEEESLKRSVQEFICFHYRDVFATYEWKEFIRQHVELASEIIHQLSIKHMNF